MVLIFYKYSPRTDRIISAIKYLFCGIAPSVKFSVIAVLYIISLGVEENVSPLVAVVVIS